MAQYDKAFAELQAKLAAVLAVVEENPDLAAQVRERLGLADVPDTKGESPAYDEARANALKAELRNFDSAIGVQVVEETEGELVDE